MTMDTNEGRAKDAIRAALQNLLWQVEQFCEQYGEADFETAQARAALSTPSPAPEVGGAVAWQERQQTREGWTSWYDASAKTAMGKGPGLSEVLNGIEYQWRPLFAAPQPADVMGVLAECVAAMEMKQRVTMWEQDGDRSKFSAALESARRALAAGALQAEHPLDALMPEICQLIDAVKIEWQQQGCWSEWDQSVRDRIAAYNIAKMKGASAGADAAGAVPEGWQSMETAPKTGLIDIWTTRRHIDCYYDRICDEHRCITEGHLIRLQDAQFWMRPPNQPAARQSPAKGE